MNREFWQNRRVLITGNTGFKGCWLSLWLQMRGANVAGYSLSVPTKPSLYKLCNMEETVNTTIADIRNMDSLNNTFKKIKPEVVFHMAAQPLVRKSYTDPVDTYSTNVMGTVNLLEAVRVSDSVKSVIIVTSDKCYENKEWVWGYRESDSMGGFDPYSSSKGCAELVTNAYKNSFFNVRDYKKHGVGIASVRAGNAIGGGDWAEDRLVTDIMTSIIKRQPILIRSPHATRPWQHVLEPLSGYIELAERLYATGQDYSESWNFGPSDDDAKPVEWIVKTLCSLWGKDASYIIDTKEHPHEAHYLKLDCSKSKTKLKWYPLWNLETALQKIVDWYKVFESGGDTKNITLEQIQNYEEQRLGEYAE